MIHHYLRERTAKPRSPMGVAATVPVLAAVVEAEAPSRRRTLCFIRPHVPSGSFQQKCHVPCPYPLFIESLELSDCRHTPTAAGNIKISNPFFDIVPVCIPIRPGIPFEARILVVNHTVVKFHARFRSSIIFYCVISRFDACERAPPILPRPLNGLPNLRLIDRLFLLK